MYVSVITPILVLHPHPDFFDGELATGPFAIAHRCLKRLNTDYIDLYMSHYDDAITPFDEIARSLEELVNAGKILFCGLANIPAWKAAAIASQIKIHALQLAYNLMQRIAERELIPLSNHFGLATMMYSPLAGSLLTAKYREGEKARLSQGEGTVFQENDQTTRIIDLLIEIAEELEVRAGRSL